MKKFKKFQIVKIQLVHDEKILKRLQEIRNHEDLVIKNKELLLFVKPRPAMVVDSYVPKGYGETKYLVIPMTSKRSIANWYGAEYPLRIEIYDNRFDVTQSYLMLDNIITLSESCIKPFLDSNSQKIILPSEEIERIKIQILERTAYLLSLSQLLEIIKELCLEDDIPYV